MEIPLLSPSSFVGIANQILDSSMPVIRLRGELSEFRISKNRWLFFKLKDDIAGVDCFGDVSILPGVLEDGLILEIFASPRLHDRYGFSLICQSMTTVGEGSIKKAQLATYRKLEKEGLFEPSRKRSLPVYPHKVAVITSKGSAAEADFVKISKNRWPLASIDYYDAQVQGEKSVTSIVDQIQMLNNKFTHEVIVVIRGGGSLEDLSSFSDERLVRAVASSRIPTLLAVGHESDESLAEMAADVRASTPSNAAEILLPDYKAELRQLNLASSQLESDFRLPFDSAREELDNYSQTISDDIRNYIEVARERLSGKQFLLEQLSPTAILESGYAVVSNLGKSTALRKVSQIGPEITIRLADGKINLKVKE